MRFFTCTFLILVSILSAYTVSAQMREDIEPRSFALSSALIPVPSSTVLSFDSAAVATVDMRRDKLGHMPRFAHDIPVDIGLSTGGTWTMLPGGDRIWRCSITAPGALALIPGYDAFFIPQGATLHVYTPDRSEVLGAFTHDHNPADGRYNTGLIHGSACIIEYYEPVSVAGTGRIHISGVGYAYRMVPGRQVSRDFDSSASCEVNVVCPEGAFWQDQKNAVVRILVKLGSDYGWCSGTLLNNANQDCTPYFLSADHCYQDESNNYMNATTADLDQWVFYFNYESPTCANPATEGTLGHHYISGCALRAASLDDGGASGSDFVLVRANSAVPLSYNPYYAGWNNIDAAPHAGVGIHHPEGDIAKISTYAADLVSSHWGNTTSGTHWQIEWVPTTDGYGVTEPGSSGSPVFDFNKRVVGTLTGGASFCTSPTAHDLYGKFSYHWASDGTTSAKRLMDWLDPNNTGIQTLDGTYAPCAPSLSVDAAVAAIQQSGPLCEPNQALTVTLKNDGTLPLQSDSLTFTVDGGSPQSLLWTGSLNTLETAQVSLPSQNFSIGEHTVTVTSSGPDGNQDENTYNDSKTTTFTVYPSTGTYTLTFLTGDQGSEVSWDLLNTDNILIASGGPYTNTSGGQTITESWCLPVGCYVFNVFNSAGAGFQGISVNGSYTITDHSGSTVAQTQGISFGSEQSADFCSTAATGIHDIAAALMDIGIYPNPSSGVYTISHTADVTSLTVTDALGRRIMSSTMTGEQSKQVDLGAQESGIYFFHFISDEGTATRKVVLSK